MKRSEAALLLAKISAYDRRTVGDADIEAWAEVLPEDMPLADALDAVRDHFRSSTEFLMPLHLIDAVRSIRQGRLRAAGTPPIPGGLDWKQEKAWRQLWCNAVKDGESAEDATVIADQAMHITPMEEIADHAARVKLIQQLADSKKVPEK